MTKSANTRKINGQLKGIIKEQDKMIKSKKYVKQERKQDRENNKGRDMQR